MIKTDVSIPEQKQTGVYAIVNVTNGHLYIGSATRSFRYRWSIHNGDLKQNKHANAHFQSAVNRYGASSFKFTIVETCPPERCIDREQYYIDTLKPEYNISQIAGSNLGIKRSKETIEKGRQAKLKYVYLIQTPQNEIIEIDSLNQFCKTFGLSLVALSTTLNQVNKWSGKTITNHKNYVMLHKRLIGEPAPENLELRKLLLRGSGEWHQKRLLNMCKLTYEIVCPDKSIAKTTNLTSFAKQFKLSQSSLMYTFAGITPNGTTCNHHKGFKVISKTPLIDAI